MYSMHLQCKHHGLFQICGQDLAELADQLDFLAVGHCVAVHGMYFLCIKYLLLYSIERLILNINP